jgi:hypothetical protein
MGKKKYTIASRYEHDAIFVESIIVVNSPRLVKNSLAGVGIYSYRDNYYIAVDCDGQPSSMMEVLKNARAYIEMTAPGINVDRVLDNLTAYVEKGRRRCYVPFEYMLQEMREYLGEEAREDNTLHVAGVYYYRFVRNAENNRTQVEFDVDPWDD